MDIQKNFDWLGRKPIGTTSEGRALFLPQDLIDVVYRNDYQSMVIRTNSSKNCPYAMWDVYEVWEVVYPSINKRLYCKDLNKQPSFSTSSGVRWLCDVYDDKLGVYIPVMTSDFSLSKESKSDTKVANSKKEPTTSNETIDDSATRFSLLELDLDKADNKNTDDSNKKDTTKSDTNLRKIIEDAAARHDAKINKKEPVLENRKANSVTRITTVKFRAVRSSGRYETNSIELTAEIGDGDDVDKVSMDLKNRAEDILRKMR